MKRHFILVVCAAASALRAMESGKQSGDSGQVVKTIQGGTIGHKRGFVDPGSLVPTVEIPGIAKRMPELNYKALILFLCLKETYEHNQWETKLPYSTYKTPACQGSLHAEYPLFGIRVDYATPWLLHLRFFMPHLKKPDAVHKITFEPNDTTVNKKVQKFIAQALALYEQIPPSMSREKIVDLKFIHRRLEAVDYLRSRGKVIDWEGQEHRFTGLTFDAKYKWEELYAALAKKSKYVLGENARQKLCEESQQLHLEQLTPSNLADMQEEGYAALAINMYQYGWNRFGPFGDHGGL